MINLVPYLLFAVLAVMSLTVGMYLVRTNPPKDESKFVGFGAEKATEEELAAREG